jgi:hypothetical protein
VRSEERGDNAASEARNSVFPSGARVNLSSSEGRISFRDRRRTAENTFERSENIFSSPPKGGQEYRRARARRRRRRGSVRVRRSASEITSSHSEKAPEARRLSSAPEGVREYVERSENQCLVERSVFLFTSSLKGGREYRGARARRRHRLCSLRARRMVYEITIEGERTWLLAFSEKPARDRSAALQE